ncbi:hypothetical protein G7Y89_g11143 [Neofusicoccum parvum]|nr:hypothetical protein G7Y89_g11143 [Neofusicoccum parvum]
MHNKLEVNADHYKTERAKISYIFSRTTGTASDTIRPNVHDGPAAFQTAEEAFTLLTSNTTPFNSFYAKFIALATESELPRDQWFEEMWTRLSGGLRHGLAPVKDSLNSSFQDLTARARTLDRELQNDIKAAEKKKERANKLLKNTKPTAVTIANAELDSGSAEDSGKE